MSSPTATSSTSAGFAERPRRRGANAYLIASGVAQAAALARYVVLARFLGPEQLGLAATLVLTGAFFDLISDTGADRFLIQDSHGDEEPVQKLVQLVYVGRGVMIAAALSLLAWPISLVYRAPPLFIGLVILSFSPLIMGLLHLDIRRLQRHLDFRGEAIALMVAEAVGLTATVAAAYLTHSFTAILYGLISRAIALVITSHVLAERPYRVAFAKEHFGRLSRFAGPLMINGMLLFFATQGDRALVGRQLGFAVLGRYSAILLLIYYPAAMLLKYMQTMYLPLLARARDDAVESARVRNVLGGQALMLGLAMAVGFAALAPFAVKVLYGAKFAETLPTVALIGVLQSSRFLLVYPQAVALSLGRSYAALAVNLARLAAYPAAFLGGVALGGLPGVVIGFTFGELLAHATGLILVNRSGDRTTFAGFERVAEFVLGSTFLMAGILLIEHRQPLAAAAAGVCGLALAIWIARRERIAIGASVDLIRRVLGRPAPAAR